MLGACTCVLVWYLVEDKHLRCLRNTISNCDDALSTYVDENPAVPNRYFQAKSSISDYSQNICGTHIVEPETSIWTESFYCVRSLARAYAMPYYFFSEQNYLSLV